MSDARRRAANRMIERNLAHEQLHREPTDEILAMRAARAIENNPALMRNRRRGQARRDSIVRMEKEEEHGRLERRVAEVAAEAAAAAAREREEGELARPAYIESLGSRVRAGSPTARTLSQFDLLGRYGEGDIIRPAASVIARTLRSGPRQSGEGQFISWARTIPRAVPPAEKPDTGETAAYDRGGVAAVAPSGAAADDRDDGSSSSSDEEEEGGAGRRRSKTRRRKRYSRKRRRTRRVSARNNHKSKIKSRKKRRRKSPRGRKSSRKYR